MSNRRLSAKGADQRGMTKSWIMVLAVLLALTGCPGLGPDNTENGVVDRTLIATASDMAKIGKDGAYPLDGIYQLTADITLTNWTPIGDSANPFTGEFDGNGKTITLQSFAGEALAGQYIGIFGYTDGAAINNLTVSVSLPELTGTSTETAYAGALIAWASDTALDGITATGTLGFTSAKGLSLGGIAGYHGGSASSTEGRNHVKNSVSSVDVTGAATGMCSVGGIHGTARYLVAVGCRAAGDVSSAGTVYNNSSGGIGGNALYSTYTGCAYEGGTVQVGGTGDMPYAGGIVGRSGSTGANVGNRLLRCSSGGTISAAGTGGWPYVGGLIGYMHGNSTISQSYSTAAVSGSGSNAYIGGLAGNCSQGSRIENSYYNGAITHTGTTTGIGGITGQTGSDGSVIRACYAAGTIASSVAAATVGGIVGQNYNAGGTDVNSCAALQSAITNSGGPATNTHRIAGSTGASAALTDNIASLSMTGFTTGAKGGDTPEGADCAEKPVQSVYEGLGWDFAAVWTMGSGGYPVLKWQAE
jgi:hypothetical protein